MFSSQNISDIESSSECNKYNPDNVFEKIKLIEFPISFVGLSTAKIINVENDLNTSVYLKTMNKNELMDFNKAREISARHRSFTLSQTNNHTIVITFMPRSECIAKSKQIPNNGNRFVIDLRIIQVDGYICCNSEIHSEIGRFYICGEYEYCTITHLPRTIDFGDIVVNTKVTKYVRIINKSQIAANLTYVRVTGFEVSPMKFTISANSSLKISVTIKPFSLLIKKKLKFEIRNPHDFSTEQNNDGDNFLPYIIDLDVHLLYEKKCKNAPVESLHKIYEPDTKYTYLGKELATYRKRKCIASFYSKETKSRQANKVAKEKLYTDTFEVDYECLTKVRDVKDFCKHKLKKISNFELFDIKFLPFSIDFGKVALETYGENIITVKNQSKYDVNIFFADDCHILYTIEKEKNFSLKLKSLTATQVTIMCQGFVEGNYEGTFDYIIDMKFRRKYPYRLYVEEPSLMLTEKSLKFGMLTNENFVTSVPIRIFNSFNVDIDFHWEDLNHDTPFKILPVAGTIRKHMCNVCDILYDCKSTKSKIHEANLITNYNIQKVIPLELNIITKKLNVKFLQPSVMFKDIALNVETVATVKLENSSREIALFHVVEPLIYGLSIKPMSGILRPKMIKAFDISVKISCVLEFAFDVIVKINNRENIILPVSGSVNEPKLLIQPKHIYMSRIPCNLITYIPITIQNISTLKAFFEFVDTGNDNIFNIYIDQGNEKIKLCKFEVNGGESKTVFIKIYDTFRREYDMYIPFKINGLLGPPDLHALSTDLHSYTSKHFLSYENNPRVKVININKDIPYCRIAGVITVPWIQISVEKFEIDFNPNYDNNIKFSMMNVYKYSLLVTIILTNLAPNFTLCLCEEEIQSTITETNITFELDPQQQVQFILKFHPKKNGKFVTTALLYLDRNLNTPYYNLTFIGKCHMRSILTVDTERIIFPPCGVGQEISRTLTLQFGGKSSEDKFSYSLDENPGLVVEFTEFQFLQDDPHYQTIIKIEIKLCCQGAYSRNVKLTLKHESGSSCDVKVSFCTTFCPLTLHTTTLVSSIENPYPFYPQPGQTELFDYLEKSLFFLEKWMFSQGFRRDLFPVIPDTFHILSTAISSPPSAVKSKGINISYLNFIKRISGPFMKHIRKIKVTAVEDTFECVKDLHDSYKEIIHLLKNRGADIWFLQARFLLSFEQFTTYTKNITPKYNGDTMLNKELQEDIELFKRLSKQCWLDFILQSYKVFIMDSCFFECMCLSSQPNDIIKVLTDWYNDQISLYYNLQGNYKQLKIVRNITSDLSDGLAIVSSILNHCPFLQGHFSVFHEVNENETAGSIINNACLIIEAMSLLKIYFPLSSEDFLEPNFVQMLFLSIHLYVTLPMMKPKDILIFKPPLLNSSSRLVTITTSNQESVLFSYAIINNTKNNFYVERAPSQENGKKCSLNIKYVANFCDMETRILLVHGYNKTRIFDTYVIFILEGYIGSLSPLRKCKVTGPLYRANKVDILVSSPFQVNATYQLFVTDNEPTIPVTFDYEKIPKFYCRRINLIDKIIKLTGIPKDSGQEHQEHKLHMQIICLSTQLANTWIWFRSEIGDFFIKVTSQPRWDFPLDTIQARLQNWPIQPCSCGEECECYRSTAIEVPHHNELMLKSLRYALSEHASEVMLEVYDKLIETTVGKIIVGMLLLESGTNMSDIEHILRSEMCYSITSRALSPEIDRVKLAQHTDAILVLPITIPAEDKAGKYSITFTSDCGMDIRTYKIVFVDDESVDMA